MKEKMKLTALLLSLCLVTGCSFGKPAVINYMDDFKDDDKAVTYEKDKDNDEDKKEEIKGSSEVDISEKMVSDVIVNEPKTLVGIVDDPEVFIDETGMQTASDLKKNDDSIKMYSIKDKVNCSNNIFSYTGIRFADFKVESGSCIVWTDSVKNISSDMVDLGIHIHLYDANKKQIGDYENIMPTSIDAGESLNPSFTIYETGFYQGLDDGHKVSEIAYFTIEDID